MNPITEEELLTVIRENPMICSRGIVKHLRPDEYRDPAAYKEYMDYLKPIMERLWKDGIIVSSKVQCCTFNLKEWRLA